MPMVKEETIFNIRINEALHQIIIEAYGFVAEIRRGLRINQATGQYQEVYSVLMEQCRPIALSQTELRKYVMFLEYVEFYLENLNS